MCIHGATDAQGVIFMLMSSCISGLRRFEDLKTEHTVPHNLYKAHANYVALHNCNLTNAKSTFITFYINQNILTVQHKCLVLLCWHLALHKEGEQNI